MPGFSLAPLPRGELFGVNPETGDARISGSLASLAGLETALAGLDPHATEMATKRILAALTIVTFTPGIPLVMIGDEIATVSNHSYRASPELASDNRWSHRHRFSPDAFLQGEAGIGPAGRVLAGFKAMLDLRRSLPWLGQPQVFKTGDRATIGFSAGPITVLANLSQQTVIINRPPATYDLLRREDWDQNVLAPYEFRILANPSPRAEAG